MSDNHSQTRRECERADEHGPHQWGDNPGPFSGLWCPGNPDVTEDIKREQRALGICVDGVDGPQTQMARGAL